MRVDNVNQNKKIGYIKFNSDAEMDLISESMDRLIQKQQKLVERTGGGGNHDADEIKKLERFKQSKDAVIERPRQNRNQLKAIKDKVTVRHEERNKKMMSIGKKDEIVDDIEDDEEFENMTKVMDNAEAGSGLTEGSEVTHRNMHVLVNALNDHIWEMEKDGLYKKTRRNQNKYEKLKQMLENAQEQKAQFERVRPKPKGYGRLRK
jgi:hypothetical protein